MMVILALCGGFSAVILNSRNKACIGVAFGSAAAFSACGILVALEVLITGPLMLSLPISSAIGQLSFGFNIVVDGLSAFFLLVICTLALPVSIYSFGYVKEYEGHYGLGRFGLLFNLFLLSMVLVVTAGNIVVFLIAWELMSLCSYFLVTFESRDTALLRQSNLLSVESFLLWVNLLTAKGDFLDLFFSRVSHLTPRHCLESARPYGSQPSCLAAFEPLLPRLQPCCSQQTSAMAH